MPVAVTGEAGGSGNLADFFGDFLGYRSPKVLLPASATARTLGVEAA
jgi:hypothetical protein